MRWPLTIVRWLLPVFVGSTIAWAWAYVPHAEAMVRFGLVVACGTVLAIAYEVEERKRNRALRHATELSGEMGVRLASLRESLTPQPPCNEWFDAWPNGEYGDARCVRPKGHDGPHWHPKRSDPNPDAGLLDAEGGKGSDQTSPGPQQR